MAVDAGDDCFCLFVVLRPSNIQGHSRTGCEDLYQDTYVIKVMERGSIALREGIDPIPLAF